MATQLPATSPPANSSAPPRWQFSLRELMVAMLVLSLYFGATYWLGPCMGVIGGLGLVAYVTWLRRWLTLIEFATIVGIATCLLALLLPDFPPAPRTGGRMQCTNHLRQISISLQNYHDIYGSFPPAYIADENGRPMHSWRVLILPFMEQRALYDQYRFDEPWDGPHNRLLHAAVVPIYCCPSDKTGAPTDTDYVVVFGPSTVFPGDQCTTLNQISDGHDKTLLVVEVHNSGIHWMEPRDLHVTQMAGTINPKAGQGINSLHLHGAMAAYVDGHVRLLPDDLPPEQLRARLTIAGGEKVVKE